MQALSKSLPSPVASCGATKMRALRSALAGTRLVVPRVGRPGVRQAPYYTTPTRAVMEQAVTQEDARMRDSAPLPGAEVPQGGVAPADDDRARFQLHWSVDMWRDFYPNKWMEAVDNPSLPLSDRLRAFTNTLTSAVSTAGILGSSEAARYWAYHLTRSGFFIVQGLAGLLAARGALGGGEQSGALTRMEQMFRRGWVGPVSEALLMYYQDHELIKEGKYVLPWEMASFRHRQFNPLFVLQRAATFFGEATDTLRRRDAGQTEQVWLQSKFMPDYYKTFHYQTDGWLSPTSAKVYETSTETLFVGRQDAMQRSTLVPIHDFMQGKEPSQLKALEVAAGTGRFATYVKDNYPGLDLTVSDLSPFYLAESRNNLKYWKRMRAPDAALGGVDGNGCTFLQTVAEKLDLPDESFDIVYCVYLFHELPADVRRRAVMEMARVLRPGGICVLTDSAQLGDRLAYDATLGNFGDFNEPYYRNYIGTPLGPLFEEAGLKCGMKLSGSTTKTLSFYKPLAPAPPEGGLGLTVASEEAMLASASDN